MTEKVVVDWLLIIKLLNKSVTLVQKDWHQHNPNPNRENNWQTGWTTCH